MQRGINQVDLLGLSILLGVSSFKCFYNRANMEENQVSIGLEKNKMLFELNHVALHKVLA